jgi:hypothetical protein
VPVRIKLRNNFSWETIKAQLNSLFIANKIPVNEIFQNTENSEHIGLNIELKKGNPSANLYHYDEELLGEFILQLITLMPDQITLKQVSIIIAYLQAIELLEITTQELAQLKANLHYWQNKPLAELITAVIIEQHGEFYFNPLALIELRKVAEQDKTVTIPEDISTAANPLLENSFVAYFVAETITQVTDKLNNNTASLSDEVVNTLSAGLQVEVITKKHLDAKINYYVVLAQFALIKKHNAKLTEIIKQLIKIDKSFDLEPTFNAEQLLQRHALLCNLDNIVCQLSRSGQTSSKIYQKTIKYLDDKLCYYAAYSLRAALQIYQSPLNLENTLIIYNKRIELLKQNNFLYLPGNQVRTSSKLLIFAAYILFSISILALVTSLIASHGLAIPILAVIGYSLTSLLPANFILILASVTVGVALFTLAVEVAKPGYLKSWLREVITNPFIYANHKLNTGNYKFWQKLFNYPWLFCLHMLKTLVIGFTYALKMIALSLANWLVGLPNKIKNTSLRLAYSKLVIDLMQKFDIYAAKKTWDKALMKAPLRMLKKAPVHLANQLQQAQYKIAGLSDENQQLNKLKTVNSDLTSKPHPYSAEESNSCNPEFSLC